MNRRIIDTTVGIIGAALIFCVGACSSGGAGSPGSGASDGGVEDSGPGTTESDAGTTEGDAAVGGGDVGCVAYASDADVTAPSVLFGSDILPLFRLSCGLGGASCHGNPAVVSEGRPLLALVDGGTASSILSGIVAHPSSEDPQMDLVAGGDPEKSYLMHKVDGDQCTLADDCAKGQSPYPDCGKGMPYLSSTLTRAERDTIRRWIAQGAKND